MEIMNKWNFEELRSLCEQRSISYPGDYLEALGECWMYANDHSETALGEWKGVIGSSFSSRDRQFIQAEFRYRSKLRACIRELHSMVDILAQVIDVVILRREYGEEKVDAKTIRKHMERNSGIAPEVRRCFIELLDSNEFKYFNAFCNTIKHRHSVKRKLQLQSGEVQHMLDIKFLGFSYNNEPFFETWASDIIEGYRQRFGQFVNNVGLSISTFLIAR